MFAQIGMPVWNPVNRRQAGRHRRSVKITADGDTINTTQCDDMPDMPSDLLEAGIAFTVDKHRIEINTDQTFTADDLNGVLSLCLGEKALWIKHILHIK